MTHYVNLIKRHKRTAASVALLGTTLMFSGCGDEPKPPVEFKLGKVEKVDTNRVGNVSEMLFNNDRNVAYVKGVTGLLHRVDLKDGLKGFTNNGNWKILTLKDEKKSGTTAGEAKLEEKEPNPRLRKMFLAKDGLLVLARLATAAAADMPALAYFKGEADVPTNAWTDSAVHVEQAPAAALSATRWWNEAVAVTMSDGTERFVVANTAFEVSSVAVGTNKFTGTHTKVAAFTSIPRMVWDKKSESVLFVSASGVAFLETSKLGATNQIATETGDAVAAKWDMVTGVANGDVNEVVENDGKLFIALTGAAANKGGIATYNIGDKKISPPALIWSNVTPRNLHVEGDNVRAVVNNTLININADGTPGASEFSLNDVVSNRFSKKSLLLGDDLSKKTQYQFNQDLPRGMTSAYKIGENVVFTGDDIGAAPGGGAIAQRDLYTVIYETANVPAAKVKGGDTK